MEKGSNVQLTRSHMESLSTVELIKLADSYGLYIPPDLDRVFIIGELLESSGEGEKQVKEDMKISTSRQETAELPKQYNISYVDFLIRDPFWIFAFWEIKELDKDIYEKSPDFNGYRLHLVSLNNGNSFTVPVDITDNSRYIGFTEISNVSDTTATADTTAAADTAATADAAAAADEYAEAHNYKIKLEADCSERVDLIAESKVFCLPRLVTNADLRSMKENPLARLSGITEISVIGTRG